MTDNAQGNGPNSMLGNGQSTGHGDGQEDGQGDAQVDGQVDAHVDAQVDGREDAPDSAPDGRHDILSATAGAGETESTFTVLVAFGANALIAVAKSVAAVLTGSASLVAEAAHSWADAGNEIFLLVAQRRSARPADAAHPGGHGREAYVWSMFAAVGLFAVGAAVSVEHGIAELVTPEPAQNFLVAYLVLVIAFVLEGISFVQSARQVRSEAGLIERDVLEHVLATSDPTLRAVFAEDAAALVGLLIAGVAVALHQVTGSALPDAIGSIVVGLLLAAVSVLLIDRNRRFLVGEAVDPRIRKAALARLIAEERILAVTYLHLEYSGPRQVAVLARVDLVADEAESRVAAVFAELEQRLQQLSGVSRVVLAPAHPGSPPLTV